MGEAEIQPTPPRTTMADQPNTQDDDSTKKETIRITLPPKAEQPSIKRETVRIAVPGTSAPAPVGDAPKKETSKIPMSAIVPPPASSPAPSTPSGVVTKPLSGTPPPPPPGAGPVTKPLSSVTPPKPPPLTGKPTIPLRPAAPAGSAAMPPPPSGIRPPAPPAPGQSGISAPPVRPASPKKETARINLPSDAAKGAPTLPKATVKMQQTQPLSKNPAPSISQMTPSMSVDSSPAKSDTAATVLSVLAFLLSGAALFFVVQIYNAAQAVPFP